MKLKQFILLPFIVFSLIASAQNEKDSVALAKVEKQRTTIDLRLKERKEKLAQLEQQLPEKQAAKDKAVTNAEESADENRRAAISLSNDPADKKKARKADNSSSDARKYAKRARIATNELKDLEDDIKALQKKISEDESRLEKLSAKAGN